MNKDIHFQVYKQPITLIHPQRVISLQEFLDFTKTPPQSTKEIFDQIAAAEVSDNKVLKAKLKQTYLHYFTLCVIVDPIRNYKSIKSFTGLLSPGLRSH